MGESVSPVQNDNVLLSTPDVCLFQALKLMNGGNLEASPGEVGHPESTEWLHAGNFSADWRDFFPALADLASRAEWK